MKAEKKPLIVRIKTKQAELKVKRAELIHTVKTGEKSPKEKP